MANTDAELVEGLKGLAEGLEADGYTLDARWTTDGDVEIIVGATEAACEDCLVPKELMRGLAWATLDTSGISVAEDKILVTYPEGSAAH